MERKAMAVWTGSGKEGKGTLSTTSKTLNETPYNYKMRFEDAPGTNPEELIGAAFSGCFTMKLSFVLGAAGFTPDQLQTDAKVTLEDGAITGIHLDVKGNVPGITKEQFESAAQEAKTTCPVGKALSAVPSTVSATLG